MNTRRDRPNLYSMLRTSISPNIFQGASIVEPPGLWNYGFGSAQTKLAASSVLPVPFHCASIGYGHSGRVRCT